MRSEKNQQTDVASEDKDERTNQAFAQFVQMIQKGHLAAEFFSSRSLFGEVLRELPSILAGAGAVTASLACVELPQWCC